MRSNWTVPVADFNKERPKAFSKFSSNGPMNFLVTPGLEMPGAEMSIVEKVPVEKDLVRKMLRGIWDSIHKTAAWFDLASQLPPEIKNKLFGSLIRYLLERLICKECQLHAQEYLRINPPELETPSIWTWKFHNSVNLRLSRPELSWDEYQNLYLKSSSSFSTICSSGCG